MSSSGRRASPSGSSGSLTDALGLFISAREGGKREGGREDKRALVVAEE